MNNVFIKNTFLFVILVFLQVTVFNNIGYLGYINPMVYLLFVVLYPYRENRIPFLFAAFLIGLSVDIFSNTGGIHAASTVFVAYIRVVVFLGAAGLFRCARQLLLVGQGINCAGLSGIGAAGKSDFVAAVFHA